MANGKKLNFEKGPTAGSEKENGEETDELNKSWEELKTAKEKAGGLLEKLGGFKEYAQAVDRFVDSLSQKKLSALCKDIFELVQWRDFFRPMAEFGINPLTPDLSAQLYSAETEFIPFNFKNQKEFWEEGLCFGTFNPLDDKIKIFYGNPSTPKEKQHLFFKETPADLKSRLKHFLKFNHFGALPAVILHENIHREQLKALMATNPNNPAKKTKIKERYGYLKKMLLYFQENELLEGQANISQFPKGESPSLYKKVKNLQPIKNKSEIKEEVEKEMQNDKWLFLEKSAAERGSDPQTMGAYYEILCDLNQPMLGRENFYNLNQDKLSIALHLFDQLRALGFNEKEIAKIIAKYGKKYNRETASFPDLEAFIEQTFQGRQNKNSNSLETPELAKPTIDDLVMEYKMSQRAKYYNLTVEKINLLKEKYGFGDYCQTV
ncbi:MAG: hypothetical protein M1127_00465 [Patescibacteria group bacterium]|nr:hypothetical protein [Patescibacteria group bacterium]